MINRERLKDPSSFERWAYPPIWCRGCELWQHVDVIMHLFFLGVVKTSMKVITAFLKQRNKHDNYVRKVDGRLEDIALLHLQWCKTMPYKQGTFGPWVSENFVAAGKLLKWFYSDIVDIVETEVFQEPDRPQGQWTAKQNKGWLKI